MTAPRRILITGARGQVGQAVAATAPPDAIVEAVDHGDLDVCDLAIVEARVLASQPEVIVNCAAYTAVDRAESEADLAHRVNAEGPANLARAAVRTGSRLIHLSTDFVFDGLTHTPYKPGDPPNPLSVYGKSKLQGEREVVERLGDRAVVLRTAWVYAASGKNFLLTMLRLMHERGSVRVVADQIGSPTAATSIAMALWAFIARPDVHGLFHWTDAGVASWYDFAIAIADEWAARTHGRAAEVVPIGTCDYPTPARRPNFSVLDRTSTVAAIGIAPRHWRHNLRDVIGEIAIA
jgi:dTDP-4-dehydrorhamnose reductase